MPFLNLLRPRRTPNQYAFVFYATDEIYAVAVMVFVHLLQERGVRRDADIVLLHLPLPQRILMRMRRMGIQTRPVERVQPLKNWGFQDCLVKLRVFELAQYDRIVYADADSFPLENLDYLFSLPRDGPIACPLANWLPQPYWTSAFFVARPSLACWSRVEPHIAIAAGKEDYFDMEIINTEFRHEIQSLPKPVFCLNSEWEEASGPSYFGNRVEAYSIVSVVHFSALGKPWRYTTEQARARRPNAHPVFFEMWDKWRTAQRLVSR